MARTGMTTACTTRLLMHWSTGACHCRSALRFLAGAAAAAAAIYLPFFLASPAGMVREVVLDQLGRPRDVVHTPFKRISSFLGATGLHLREPWAAVLSPNKLGL